MKTLLLSILSLAASPAIAAGFTHLSKDYQSGFSRPHRSISCDFYDGRVVTTTTEDGRQLSRRIRFRRWPGNVSRLMSESQRGQRAGSCNIADVPTTTWSYQIGQTGPTFLLREDCRPAPGIRINSRAADQLERILDSACGQFR